MLADLVMFALMAGSAAALLGLVWLAERLTR